MNELQRMQYLDAMDIDMFVPRVLLTHSAQIRQCQLPVAAEPAVVDSHATPLAQRKLPEAARSIQDILGSESFAQGEQGQASSSERQQNAGITSPVSASGLSGRILDKLEENQAPRAAEVQAAELPAKSEFAAEKREAANFTLSLWRVSDETMVLDSREPMGALPTQRLLENILIASELISLRLPKPQDLQWPLPASQGRDQSWQAASEMVNELVGTQASQKPLSSFILFGESALKSLLADSVSYKEVLGSTISLDNFSARALVLPSLAYILRHPECKARLWRSLQKLKA